MPKPLKDTQLFPLVYSLHHAITCLQEGNVLTAQTVLRQILMSVADLAQEDTRQSAQAKKEETT